MEILCVLLFFKFCWQVTYIEKYLGLQNQYHWMLEKTTNSETKVIFMYECQGYEKCSNI